MAAFAFMRTRCTPLFADAAWADKPEFVTDHQENEEADRNRNADS